MIRSFFTIAMLFLLVGSFTSTLPAQASLLHPAVVSENPADTTPHIVLDGGSQKIMAFEKVDNTIYAGGVFAEVMDPLMTTTYSRQNFFAFDSETGVISPLNLSFNGIVTGIEAYEDQNGKAFLFISGAFNQVNEITCHGIAKYDIDNDQIDQTFAPGDMGTVSDIKLANGALIAAGNFQKKLMAIDPMTGADLGTIDITVTGNVAIPEEQTRVRRIAISPDGTRLVATGNFDTVGDANGDQPRKRAFMLNLESTPATLSDWYAPRFDVPCGASSRQVSAQGVDFSPVDPDHPDQPSYFVIVTTGGPTGIINGLCDAAARFETANESSSVEPTWINWTGGDSLWSVAVTGAAVYVGGHQRWLDNPAGWDSAGGGEFYSPGIGAIDPETGDAIRDWNPTILPELTDGTRALLATPDGLWVGSDGKRFGGEDHVGIGFAPFDLNPDDPDTTRPETFIDSGPSGPVSNTSATFSFSSSEDGTFQCRIDGAAFTPCTSPVTYENLGFSPHTFQVVAVDFSYNMDASPAEQNWTVVIQGSELIGNPGFEVDASGWTGDASANVLTRVTGGHSGGWAVEVSNTEAGGICGLNDSPNWVSFTEDGPYTASIWARSDTPGATLRLRVREYAGGVRQGTVTETVTLTSSWQQVTVNYSPVAPGSSLDFEAYTTDAPVGVCFQADDASITMDVDPPAVDAGPDQFVSLPDSAMLDGTVTDDGLPDPPGAVFTNWRQVDGPGLVTFADANAVDTAADFSIAGNYVLRLSGDDGLFEASDDVTIHVTGYKGIEVVEVPITAGEDDAEEDALGNVDLTSLDLQLPPGGFVGAYQQDPGSDGIVSIEAENFDVNTSQGGHEWIQVVPVGYSGSGAMEAFPNNGANNDIGYETNSPRLDFAVNFVKTGTHYVWIRGIGATGSDDSVHVGLDGAGLSTSDRISTFYSDWTWSNNTMDIDIATINVSTPGIHTVNIWMREDGFVLDKLVLTDSWSYTPTGEGPAESIRGGDPIAGMRFTGVNVPQGATIVNAYVQFQTGATSSDLTFLTIEGESVDNSATFESTSNNISSRPTTVASVPWIPDPWLIVGETGFNQRTTNIASIIQEIVGRPGWTIGNSLVIIITGTGKRVAESYNGDPSSAPLLHVEYATTPNNTPLAAADDFTTPEDTALNGNVLVDNGSGADNLGDEPATLSVVTGPSNGTLTTPLAADGSFTYTPNPNFNGNDQFTYRITDADAETSDAVVSITVTAVNDGTPLAAADDFTTPEDTALNGNVLVDNGSGADNLGDEPATLSVVTGPSNGTLTTPLAADGSFTYTPNPNFNGNDQFTYRITDADAETSDAVVSITVTAVNDGTPLAAADDFTTPEDTALNGNVLVDNGSGADNLGDEPATLSVVTGPSNGTLTTPLAADGSFTYTPNPNFNGNDQFTYRITDADAETSDAVVSITVTAVNDGTPLAAADDFTTPEDTALNGNVLVDNGSGADNLGDEPATLSVVTGPSNGTLTTPLAADGSFTYTPNPNFNGNDQFTYRITDADAETSDAVVSITVTAVNDGTPLAAADDFTTPEDTALNGNVLVDNGSGADNLGDEPATLSVVTGPSNGTLTTPLAADGSFTYTPNPNFNGNDQFTYRITDADAETSDAVVSITVTAVNDGTPLAAADDFTTPEDTALNGNVLVDNGSGADNLGDEPATLSVVTGPSNGTLTTPLAADGSFTYTPNPNFNGNDQFTYRITDADAETSDAVVSITVIANCPGDFDNDGDVDDADLADIASDFGRTDCSGDCAGDFEGNGDVDGSDLAVFATDFGRTDCP